MAARFHLIPSGAMLAVLVVTCTACGDLYTDGVLSLDWLVDSADEIHRVQFVVRESDGGVVSEPREVLKPKSGKSALKTDDVARIRPHLRPPRSGEWLFFVRLTENGQVGLVRVVHLDHPMASYKTAAFTRDGTPLRDRDAILRALKARIALGRHLPSRCNRGAVEALRRLAHSNGRISSTTSSYPFGDPAPLEQFLGGMLVRIDCDDWDQEGPYDADTWLNVAVVPVEPHDHERLLEAARLGEQYKGSPRYCHPIPCLVNFPGKKTEESLREMLRDPKARRSHDSRIAAYVLWYFHYRLQATDPLDQQLIGSWRLEGQRERIDVKLEKDDTFTATAWDWNPLDDSWYTKEMPRRAWHGKGYWVVRDGQLSIFRTHAFGSKREREIFADKPILKVTEANVVLKGGPPMRRKKAAEPPYAKSPSPKQIDIRLDLADCRRFFHSQRLVFVGSVFDSGSYAAEFRNQYREKVTLLFPNHEYWTDEAKKQNIQPILFHFHDEREQVDYYYEILRRSDEERRFAAILQRAKVGRDELTPDNMEPQERIKWVVARIRDRQPVVKQAAK